MVTGRDGLDLITSGIPRDHVEPVSISADSMERASRLVKNIGLLPDGIGLEALCYMLLNTSTRTISRSMTDAERLDILESEEKQSRIFSEISIFFKNYALLQSFPERLKNTLCRSANHEGVRFTEFPQHGEDMSWIDKTNQLSSRLAGQGDYLKALRQLNSDEANSIIDLALETTDIQSKKEDLSRYAENLPATLIAQIEATGPGRLQPRFAEVAESGLIQYEFIANSLLPEQSRALFASKPELFSTTEGKYIDEGCELLVAQPEESTSAVRALSPLPLEHNIAASTGLALLDLDLKQWPGEALGIYGNRLVIPLHFEHETFGDPVFWKLSNNGNAQPIGKLKTPPANSTADDFSSEFRALAGWHMNEGQKLISKFETEYPVQLGINSQFGGILNWAQEPWTVQCPECQQDMTCIASIEPVLICSKMSSFARNQSSRMSLPSIGEQHYALLCTDCLVAATAWDCD